ncbi:unnamed protein product [Urochloa humidicola]
MEAVDLEGKLGSNESGYKRSDLEKITGEVVGSGDAKRPREGNHYRAIGMDMDDDDEEVDMEKYKAFGMYCKNWIDFYGRWAKFEDATDLLPMRHTDGPVLPMCAVPIDTMEIFFVKVAQITGELRWPLDVYGDVAVRDSLDHKRNYLFRRRREECQTLTSPQDSLLELTGPTRAVLLLDEPAFEIDLKVKGKEESEDKVLCCDVFGYYNIAYRGDSYAKTKVISSEHSAIEVRFAHLRRSLEATISIRMTTGSNNFWARLTSRTVSIGEKVVLLDTQGQEVSVSDDGNVYLQRRVVVVEEQGELILGFEVAQLGDNAQSITASKEMTFPARCALRSEGYFVIGSTRLHVLVAWSVLP